MRKLSLAVILLAVSGCAMMQPGPQRPSLLVFFDRDSAQLDADANGVVSKAAAIAKQESAAQVVVLGYAGNAGGAQADQALSDARAKAVASQLAADGVDASRIVSQGRGKTDEDPAVARRRVEIEIRG